MPQKYRLLSLIVICFTLLFFTWMIRDSLCELHIKQGGYELAAFFSLQFERVRVFGGKLFPPFLRPCAFSLHPNLFFTKIILDFITRSIIYFLKNKKNPRQMAGILDSVLLSRDYRLVTLPAAGPLAPLSMVKDTF